MAGNAPATAPPADPPHPTVIWLRTEVWPLAGKLYNDLPDVAVGIGGVAPYNFDAFQATMASDKIYTCTVNAKAFKHDRFSFGNNIPSVGAVKSRAETVARGLKAGVTDKRYSNSGKQH